MLGAKKICERYDYVYRFGIMAWNRLKLFTLGNFSRPVSLSFNKNKTLAKSAHNFFARNVLMDTV